ncbi:glycosyltransferase family 1 protein [Plantibacter sp. ME-Dv--P-122b]|uniref:rhamnosyltransferase WsaF family glycosyltransferase n=1 Tax=Plantibacter sp. ME-Dv--P-122b TaxID=3040300 RepID=UPI00255063A0|nr:glycosyltransferase family 1 protein [Plantibacter sp. ME-Dv--P-122b]
MAVNRFRQKLGRARKLVQDEGVRNLFGYIAQRTAIKLLTREPAGGMLVDSMDVSDVDWTEHAERFEHPTTVTEGPVKIAWIMSPPGKESGGHQNLFRFINFAEQAGHECTIYLYDNVGAAPTLAATKAMLRESSAYPNLRAEIVDYDREAGVRADTQALFATGWETAYPAYRDASSARRFYFVQDFEPLFYPLGSQALLAENTYKFGFHGITAGGWLQHKLSTEYGMPCDSFDFAVDKTHYSVTNRGKRDEIFFYARPVTPRRAFELGILALTEFARMRPDVTINLAGWDVSEFTIPFKHNNLASMEINQLNAVYNRCGAGLVLSLTNMSLLPLELMSAGVTPVVNDGPNNRMVSDNENIEYVQPSPLVIAKKLVEVIERPDAIDRSVAMSASVEAIDWADSGTQFVDAFERAMRG